MYSCRNTEEAVILISDDSNDAIATNVPLVSAM